MPMESIALTVNRLCSSGLQSVVTTAQQIMPGDINYGAGGGVEVMSRGGYMSANLQQQSAALRKGILRNSIEAGIQSNRQLLSVCI